VEADGLGKALAEGPRAREQRATERIFCSVHRLQNTLVALVIAVPIGGIGASAFNPQRGFVLHSYVLWEIFGLVFELGLALVVIVTLLIAIVGVGSFRWPRRT
jgi:hypothetical protein